MGTSKSDSQSSNSRNRNARNKLSTLFYGLGGSLVALGTAAHLYDSATKHRAPALESQALQSPPARSKAAKKGAPASELHVFQSPPARSQKQALTSPRNKLPPAASSEQQDPSNKANHMKELPPNIEGLFSDYISGSEFNALKKNSRDQALFVPSPSYACYCGISLSHLFPSKVSFLVSAESLSRKMDPEDINVGTNLYNAALCSGLPESKVTYSPGCAVSCSNSNLALNYINVLTQLLLAAVNVHANVAYLGDAQHVKLSAMSSIEDVFAGVSLKAMEQSGRGIRILCTICIPRSETCSPRTSTRTYVIEGFKEAAESRTLPPKIEWGVSNFPFGDLEKFTVALASLYSNYNLHFTATTTPVILFVEVNIRIKRYSTTNVGRYEGTSVRNLAITREFVSVAQIHPSDPAQMDSIAPEEHPHVSSANLDVWYNSEPSAQRLLWQRKAHSGWFGPLFFNISGEIVKEDTSGIPDDVRYIEYLSMPWLVVSYIVSHFLSSGVTE